VGWYHKKHFLTHTHPDHQTAFLPPNLQRQITEGTRKALPRDRRREKNIMLGGGAAGGGGNYLCNEY